MHILFNGDSNMSGEELNNRGQCMAGVIANHFGATATNIAVSGASNDLIYNSTLDYLRNNPAPDLVVIGWTEHGREQWYFDGEFHEINQLDVGQRIPEQFRRRYQFWKNHIQKEGEWHRVMGYYWHNKIYNLHLMLQEKNIPHLFFNAFNAFQVADLGEQLDWANAFFHPYHQNLCYINYCVEHEFKEITPGWQHYDHVAHEAWGNTMIDYMNNHPAYDTICKR
jgi:hypothetical protein